MRRYDVAYNPPLPFNGEKQKPIEEMNIDELKKEIRRTCAKSYGDFDVCRTCKGCEAGRMLTKMMGEQKKVAVNRNVTGLVEMKKMSPDEKQ